MLHMFFSRKFYLNLDHDGDYILWAVSPLSYHVQNLHNSLRSSLLDD